MEESHMVILVVALVVVFMFWKSSEDNKKPTVVVQNANPQPRANSGASFAAYKPDKEDDNKPFHVFKKLHTY